MPSNYACPASGCCGDGNLPLDMGYCLDHDNCPMYHMIVNLQIQQRLLPGQALRGLSELDMCLAVLKDDESIDRFVERMIKAGR